MSSYKRKKTAGDTAWFVRDRFGMFIHFGLYALPARHEWVKHNEKLTDEDYDKYFERFDPDLCDAREWARAAKEAGMKYAVFTAKHHEGFCLFDSRYTDYKCTNTPAGRDLAREYVDAFRAEGLRVGFYYSLIDWHHPDFTIDRIHPLRDLSREEIESLNAGRDMRRYAAYMRDQVAELLTNYGRIDIMWFDFSYPAPSETKPWLAGKGRDDWEAEKLVELARSLQPDIIIDDRAGVEGDIRTPEQYQIDAWPRDEKTGEYFTWEACQTFSGSWGYNRDEYSWKSPETLIRMLIRTVARGGNLLLNVGPTARGYIDARAKNSLSAIGEWMKYNGRSIYGCTMAEPDILSTCPNGCYYTQSEDGSRLYIHLFDYPFGFLEIKGLAGRVKYAQFLHDGSEIQIKEKTSGHFSDGAARGDDMIFFSLPAVRPDVTVPVIEVFLK